MDQGNLELSSTEQTTAVSEGDDISLAGSEFVSTHPDQDSLRFVAPRAEYQVKNSIIYAKDGKSKIIIQEAVNNLRTIVPEVDRISVSIVN